MASSFKQQCPSCEHMVPIRDPNLIGKKIDCPQCKYRFVVEEPADEVEEDLEEAPAKKKGKRRDDAEEAPAKGKKGKGKRRTDDEESESTSKKSSGGNNKMLVGVGVGVVALAVLAGAGYFLFMDGGNKNPTGTGGGGTTVASGDPNANAGGEANPGDAPAKEEKPVAVTTPADLLLASVSSMLPPDCDGVCNVRLRDLCNTSYLGSVAVGPRGISPEAVQKKLGIAIGEVDLMLSGWNLAKNWSLCVIHSRVPFNRDAVKLALRAKDAQERIEEQNYYILDSNPWLDSLGRLAFAAIVRSEPGQIKPRSGPLSMRFHDDQTLVFADLAPMKEFLKVKGVFPPRPKAPEAPRAATAAQGEQEPGVPTLPGGGKGGLPGGPPGGGGDDMRSRMMNNQRGRGAPPGLGEISADSSGGDGTGSPDGQAKPAEQATSIDAPTFQTIEHDLKAVLDKLEAKQPIVSIVLNTKVAKQTKIPLMNQDALKIQTLIQETGIVGVSFQQKDGVLFNLVLDFQNDSTAKQRTRAYNRKQGEELVKRLGEVLKTTARMATEEPNPFDVQGNNPDGGFGGPGGFGTGSPDGGDGARMQGMMQQGMRGGAAGPGGPPGRGGGGTGASMIDDGGGAGPGGAPNALANQTRPEEPPAGATLKVSQVLPTAMQLSFTISEDKVKEFFRDEIVSPIVVHDKGYLDMASGQMRVHEFANALKNYESQKNGELPRGTLDRPIPTTRAGRGFAPNQRMSWMVDLLPYLGPEQESLSRQLNRKLAWSDPENLPVAGSIVPQFLIPSTPASSWWVKYPGVSQEAAATHFVGLAGIGMDAPEYAANDPANTHRLGAFGYDRAIGLKDITDGLENTILAASVPPTYKRAWIAGGGATVQGVPEKNSVKPFVTSLGDNKKGAMLLMADGSVRIMAENVADDVFQALVTIKANDNKDKAIQLRDAIKLEPPAVEAPAIVAPVDSPAPATPATEGGEQPAAAEWKEFKPASGSFTVMFPGQPVEKPTTIQGISFTTYAAGTADTKATYGVTVNDLPEAAAALVASNPDALLDLGVKSAPATIPGSKLSGEIKKISQGNYKGRELSLEIAGKGQMTLRVYLSGKRQYQIFANGPKEAIENEATKKYFESFKILD